MAITPIRRAALALLAAPLPAAAQARPADLHAELLLGGAWNVPTPLVIRLPDGTTVRRRARWSTRPWADAPYYAYRAGGAFEGELLHHKLYLENPRPPIEHLEVTHGYNLVTANAVRPARRLAVRLGIGLVVAHAEGTIAGERVGGTRRTRLGGGYHLAGVTAQAAVGRAYPLARGRTVPYTVPEAKLTASLARVPVGDRGGSALVPNVALHALAGVGVRRAEDR